VAAAEEVEPFAQAVVAGKLWASGFLYGMFSRQIKFGWHITPSLPLSQMT
jgi:hypothetical protein